MAQRKSTLEIIIAKAAAEHVGGIFFTSLLDNQSAVHKHFLRICKTTVMCMNSKCLVSYWKERLFPDNADIHKGC